MKGIQALSRSHASFPVLPKQELNGIVRPYLRRAYCCKACGARLFTPASVHPPTPPSGHPPTHPPPSTPPPQHAPAAESHPSKHHHQPQFADPQTLTASTSARTRHGSRAAEWASVPCPPREASLAASPLTAPSAVPSSGEVVSWTAAPLEHDTRLGRGHHCGGGTGSHTPHSHSSGERGSHSHSPGERGGSDSDGSGTESEKPSTPNPPPMLVLDDGPTVCLKGCTPALALAHHKVFHIAVPRRGEPLLRHRHCVSHCVTATVSQSLCRSQSRTCHVAVPFT